MPLRAPAFLNANAIPLQTRLTGHSNLPEVVLHYEHSYAVSLHSMTYNRATREWILLDPSHVIWFNTVHARRTRAVTFSAFERNRLRQLIFLPHHNVLVGLAGFSYRDIDLKVAVHDD